MRDGAIDAQLKLHRASATAVSANVKGDGESRASLSARFLQCLSRTFAGSDGGGHGARHGASA